MTHDTKICDQYDRTFSKIGAYAVVRGGEHLANISTKYGTACVAYVHWFHDRPSMTRGMAGGSGYDKTSAAIATAAEKLNPGGKFDGVSLASLFRQALLRGPDGLGWRRALEDAGFAVWTVL